MDYISKILSSGDMTLELIVWSLFIGIVIAAVIIVYNKRVLGSLVRALLDANAFSPESALSLADTKCKALPLIRLSLREGSTFRNLVGMVPAESKGNEKYFINPDCESKARSMYQNTGSDIIAVIVTLLLFFAVALLTINFLPVLLDAIKTSYNAAL